MKLGWLAAAATVIVALVSATDVHRATAQIYPYSYAWCGSFGGGGGREGYSGGENCGFKTYEQCMAGVQPGGLCRPNPWYRGEVQEPAPQRRRHKSYAD
jgi:hypothetical protein